MRKKVVSLFVGIFVFVLISTSQIQSPAKYGLAITALCIILWLTEAVPKGVTGLIPAVLVPLFGIMLFEEIIVNYMSRVVFLLLSGFIIASAIQKWKLDKKIIYSMLKFTNDFRFVLLFLILSTALISALIANTTSAAIMLPIGLSIVNSLPKNLKKKLEVCILLSVAYAASIGGELTLIGSTPNLLTSQFLSEEGIYLGFSDWMKLVAPFSLLMLIVLWMFMLFKFKLLKREEIKVKIEKIPEEVGAKVTALIIISAITIWVIKPIVPLLQDIDDVLVGLGTAILLIVVPIPGRKILLGWGDVKIPWNILLMFGGGLALGHTLLVSGAAQYIVDLLPEFSNSFILLLIVSTTSVFLTELVTNTAFASTFIPIFLIFAKSIGMNLFLVVLTVGVCSSLAFMLPIGTPPNAIVYRVKEVKISDMVKTGFFMNIMSILLWSLYVLFLTKFLF